MFFLNGYSHYYLIALMEVVFRIYIKREYNVDWPKLCILCSIRISLHRSLRLHCT